MLNVGFIGFGKSVTRYHLPYLLKRRDKITVKKIYSPEVDMNLANVFNLSHDIFCDSLEELLNDNSIDVISICTPPNTHYDLAMKALKSNKNVLVEKPFCSNPKEAKNILEYAALNNLIAMPYQNRRFDSDVIVAKEIIESKMLGNIFEAEFHFDRYRPIDNRPKSGTEYDGEFYGLGVHLLDKAIYLFGIPNKVFYDIKSLRKKDAPDDTFEMQLFYEDKKVILKVNQLIIGEYPTIRINGDKGCMMKYGMDVQESYLKNEIFPNSPRFGKDDNDISVKISTKDGIVTKVIKTPIGDYGRIYDIMYNSIKSEQSKFVTDDEIMASIKILFMGISDNSPFIREV